MIDTAEMIDGVPCVQLQYILAYKLIADRPKDRSHISVIRERTG